MEEMFKIMMIEKQGTRTVQAILKEKGKFTSLNITEYLDAFEEQVQIQGLLDDVLVKYFGRVVSSSILESIQEYANKIWEEFKKKLHNMFYLEDISQHSREGFLRLLNIVKSNESLTHLHGEFMRHLAQLPEDDRNAINPDVIIYFFKILSLEDRAEIERRIEEPGKRYGLTDDWEKVKKEIEVVAQMKQRQMILYARPNAPQPMETPTTRQVDMPMPTTTATANNSAATKALIEFQLDILCKQMENVMNMQESLSKEVANLNKQVYSLSYNDLGASSSGVGQAPLIQPVMPQYIPPQPVFQPASQLAPQAPFQRNNEKRETGGKRCVWCDSQEHATFACDELKSAKENQLVVEIDRRLCDFRSRLPLSVNWGKGGMKKLYENLTVSNATATTSAARLE
ncbi:hypothetical protein KP509_12G087800 [Ceratopteris richardii]|uniref:Uncharacterized protein n=1 Tax=Ceratopteris richardii TaxID=49495 RepID=A0A8T2TNM0_CERRI|nr:hypothetical protein KP509_12G087800 [Ceratopteris richardii]